MSSACGIPHGPGGKWLCLVCRPCVHPDICIWCKGCTNDACNNELRKCPDCRTGVKCNKHSMVCMRTRECIEADAHEQECAPETSAYHGAPCNVPRGTWCKFHRKISGT